MPQTPSKPIRYFQNLHSGIWIILKSKKKQLNNKRVLFGHFYEETYVPMIDDPMYIRRSEQNFKKNLEVKNLIFLFKTTYLRNFKTSKIILIETRKVHFTRVSSSARLIHPRFLNSKQQNKLTEDYSIIKRHMRETT